MVKNNNKIILLMIILLVPLVLAGYNKGNITEGLTSSYTIDSKITGWINLSFTEEPSDSILSGNFGGNITLKNLLDENKADYSCKPANCLNQYITSSGAGTKEYDLNSNNKIIALKITGNFKNIISNGIYIKFSGTNTNSCLNPLKIDILDDGTIDWVSTNSTNDYSCTYGSGYGCFNTSSSTITDTEIDETPYCNKMRLPQGSSFEFGSYIKKGQNAINYYEDLLNMDLYDNSGDFIDTCTFKRPGPTSQGGLLSCRINYTNENLNDYYICLSAKESANGYLTKYESESKCGFFDYPPSQNYVGDYQIYAKSSGYGNTGIFNITESTYEEQGNYGVLTEYISNYIEEMYESNCTEGCVIPIKLISESQINIKILEASLKYRTSAGIVETKTIYDSDARPARINTQYQILDITPANFNTPTTYGNSTLRILYKNSELLTKKIEVKKIPLVRSLRPNITMAYLNTLFTAGIANLESNTSMKYSWDFGDGTTLQTTTQSATHSYTKLGNYTIKLTATDNKGNTNTNKFLVIIKNPREIINGTIITYKNNLNKVNVAVSQLPQWQASIIKEKLSLNNSDRILSDALAKYIEASNTNDSESFITIMQELSKLNIPQSINATNKGNNILIITDLGYISSSNLKDATDLEYPISENLPQAIQAWSDSNLVLSMDYQTISGYNNGIYNDIMTVYKIKIKPLKQIDKAYLMLYGKDFDFSTNYSQYDGGGFYGIPLQNLNSNVEKTIEFSVDSVDNPSRLISYIAPKPTSLDQAILKGDDQGTIEPCNFNNICESNLDENTTNCPTDCKDNTKKIVYIIAVLFGALIVYILMMWWYRHKYGLHLFKNKNDFANIMTYIVKSEMSNVKEEKIVENLEKSGWTSEQIKYAYKKYRESKK